MKRAYVGEINELEVGPLGAYKCAGWKQKTLRANIKTFSQIIASLSTVLCSTGTILRRKGNREKSRVKSRQSKV